MKKILLVVLLMAFAALAASPACSAAEPRRIVLLPVAATWHARQSADVEAQAAATLAAWFHTPLASFVKVYDIVPADEVRAALTPDRMPDPRQPDPARLRALADKLHADLVLGIIITDVGEFIARDQEGDYKLQTDVAMRLIGYQADSRRFINVAGREDYNDYWTADGEAVPLAAKLTERLLAKAAGDREFWSR